MSFVREPSKRVTVKKTTGEKTERQTSKNPRVPTTVQKITRQDEIYFIVTFEIAAPISCDID